QTLGIVSVAEELTRAVHAGLDDAVVRRGLADLGATHHVLELTDAGLDLALLVLGGVVATVLLEVALVASGTDALDDLLAHGTGEVLQLGLQLVVGLLGQPDLVLDGLRHRVTPVCGGTARCGAHGRAPVGAWSFGLGAAPMGANSGRRSAAGGCTTGCVVPSRGSHGMVRNVQASKCRRERPGGRTHAAANVIAGG